jgi:hypothetical protein
MFEVQLAPGYFVVCNGADFCLPLLTSRNRPNVAGGRCISIVAGVWLSLINQGELKPE